ncbi:MAG: TonB-dependent receptor, partial [Bacteroidales bacterium]|nr:TonB-dependent receptor [Bacteroidales bacterium]
MYFKNFFAGLGFLLLTTLSLNAQTYQLKATFKDKDTKEGIEFATVSVTPKGESTATAYSLSDEKGSVTIRGLRPGTYTVKSELMGYKAFSKEIEIKNANVDLGDQTMEVEVNVLESATVTSVGNPIVVKKDTIEYNASSFKTNDNDMLEDLLKKLPGVEVSSDGTVTANGKTISKITVDGKTFFLNDPTLSTKNLPAKIIEKVKVLEKKSDQSLFTGIDDGNTETIIDLTIAPGMQNSWMGNIVAGGGIDLQSIEKGDNFFDVNKPRYSANAMLGRFTSNGTLALIANANNANNLGFGNMAGMMMRTGRGGGGMGGGGINSSYMAGFQAGTRFGKNSRSEATGSYSFNGNNNYSEESTYRITLRSKDSSLLSDESGMGTQNTTGHGFSGKLDWYISDQTSIVIEPQINIGRGSFAEGSTFSTANADGQYQQLNKVNDGFKESFGNNNSLSASGRVLFRQRLAKPGRTISLNVNYSMSRNNTDGFNQSLTKTYNERDEKTGEEKVDQHYLQTSKSNSVNGRLSYTDHLGGSYFLELTYSYAYSNSDSNKDTYDKDASGKYTIKNERYSNQVTNTNINHNAGINLMRQDDDLSMTIGASVQPYSTKSTTIVDGKNTTIEQAAVNWSPNARLEYDFNNTTSLRLTYNGRTSQPSVNQLNPVEDNTNPLRIVRGNPDLTQTFSHNVNVNFFRNNRQTFSSMNASMGFTYNNNNIVNGSWTTKQGVTYSVPMNNKKGTFSTNARFMFNIPIAKSNFSVMNEIQATYSRSISFVGKDNIDGNDPSSYLDPNNYNENKYTTININENLRFTY